jgi:choline dehydrogenase-like flavoprotein
MSALPRNHTLHIVETVAILWHFLLYLFLGRGILASGGQPGGAFVHSSCLDPQSMTVNRPSKEDGNANQVPDIEILIIPLSTLMEHGVPGVPCLTWNAALVQPASTGTVELTGADPAARLKIDLPLLSDELDRTRMRKAVRFAMRLADELSSPQTVYPHPAPLAMAPGIDLAWLDGMLDKSKSRREKRKLAKNRPVPPQKDA